MRHQQNLKGRKMALLVMSKNNWDLIKTAIAQIMAAISVVDSGSCTEVQIPG